MKKRNLTFILITISGLILISLSADTNKLQIHLTAGRSMSFSELDEPKYENSSKAVFINKNYFHYNYGIIFQRDIHMLEFSYKYFGEGRENEGECNVSNEIYRKKIWDHSIKYGRLLYSNSGIDLSAFAGLGLINRKIYQPKAGPSRTILDEFVSFPIKININRLFFERIGLNTSAYCDLNFEEIIYGFEINLVLRVL